MSLKPKPAVFKGERSLF